MTAYNIYKVDEDYIAAETKEQALECHAEAIGDYCGELPEIYVIDPNTSGRFETEHGYQELTFGEWLADFEYTEPVIICWNE